MYCLITKQLETFLYNLNILLQTLCSMVLISSALFMAVGAVPAGCPLHLAVYRHVFSAPGAQAQMCIPADKASISTVFSLKCPTVNKS